ncbi:hypothetical protein YC2023_052471 [Brassica napus]
MLSALDPRGLFISGETLLMRVRRLKRSTGWSSARFVGMGAVKVVVFVGRGCVRSSARDMFFHLLKPFVCSGGVERWRVSFLLRLASRRRSLMSSLSGGTRRVSHLVGALQGCRAVVCRFFSLGLG